MPRQFETRRETSDNNPLSKQSDSHDHTSKYNGYSGENKDHRDVVTDSQQQQKKDLQQKAIGWHPSRSGFQNAPDAKLLGGTDRDLFEAHGPGGYQPVTSATDRYYDQASGTYISHEQGDQAGASSQHGQGDQAGLSEELENRLSELMKSERIRQEDYEHFLNQCSNNEADQCVRYLNKKSFQEYSLYQGTFIRRKKSFAHYVEEKKRK